jgi:NAD(P)-dependent dehydrogenase (short-subunit alcohol dehydrogenase family)
LTSKLFDLSGKTAVVVGGTTGIGHSLALGLADAGADVVASSRRAEEVERTAAEIEAKGRKTIRCTSDVKDRASLVALRDAVIAALGKVDIVVNCAGTTKRSPTLTVSEDEWNHIVETNLTGTLRGCQVFGETMLAQGSGRIINIASLTTFLGFHEVAAYACSKAAVGALTKTLAVEWSKRGVLVNAIAPGMFRTALNSNLLDNTERGKELKLRTPMARWGHTDELIGAAVYLASDAASFVAGEIMAVDGGFLASGVNQ